MLKVLLHTNQRPVVFETIQEKSVYYVKREFIEMKYEETSKLFLECYDWFIKQKGIIELPFQTSLWEIRKSWIVDVKEC